jgi:hypothetical protein
MSHLKKKALTLDAYSLNNIITKKKNKKDNKYLRKTKNIYCFEK